MNIQLSDHFTLPRLLRFTLPSIAMMVFTSIYGVVDGFFVSNFAGKTAFAAINLVMPFTMILGGMGFMVGAGGTALVSSTMGSGDYAKANRYFSMMILFTTYMGLILTAIGLAFMEPIAKLLGATEEMLPDCLLYGRIVVAFTVSFMLQNVFQSFLVAAERPQLGLFATIFAGVTNMILDGVFVGWLRWGVAGAAVATGIAQCVGAIIPLVFFLRKKDSPLWLSFTRLEAKPVLKACGNGSSELMSNISGSIVAMVFNLQLLKYLGENGVSAYGVLMYVQFIFVAIFLGYSIGVAPVISFQYGAENNVELKNLFRKSITLVGGTGIVLCGVAYVLAEPMSRLFVGYDAELLEITCHAFKLTCFAFLFSGLNIFASSFFTALNNGTISAVISFMRTLVFQISFILVLPQLIEVDGLWLAMVVSDACAMVLSAIFLCIKRKTYHYF